MSDSGRDRRAVEEADEAARRARSRERDYKCVDSPGRAAKLFGDAIKHYISLTRILDKLNVLAPYREKEAIQWALGMSYDHFRRWEREFRQLTK